VTLAPKCEPILCFLILLLMSQFRRFLLNRSFLSAILVYDRFAEYASDIGDLLRATHFFLLRGGLGLLDLEGQWGIAI